MKKTWYLPFVLEGLLAAVIFWNYPGDGTVLAALDQPFVLLGRGLRWLSLSGAAGNVAAWAVYLAICLAPLGWLVWKRIRGKSGKADLLLLLLSGVLAWGLYCLINPTCLPGVWGATDVGALSAAQVIWSALLCCSLFSLLGTQNPGKLLGWLLNALGAVLVLSACGVELGRLVLKLEAVRKANSIGGLAATNGFLILRWVWGLITCGLDLWVLEGSRALVKGLRLDANARESVDAASVLIRRGTLVLQTAVLGSLGLNLLQILAGEHLREVDLHVSLPLTSIVLILAGILLCRLLTRGRELQEDSDLII